MFTVTISVFIIFPKITGLNGIRCYECGTEAVFLDYDSSHPPSPSRKEHIENVAVALESCSNLESSYSSWGPSVVDCGPDQICVKTVIDDGIDDYGRHRGYLTASRGCSMPNTSYGKMHDLGCGILKSFVVSTVDTTPKRWDLVCYCNTDYCNGSTKLPVRTPLNLLLVSVIFFVYFNSFKLFCDVVQ